MRKIGNSIISLGSFGGTRKYKYMGYKDSFGLHRGKRNNNHRKRSSGKEIEIYFYMEENTVLAGDRIIFKRPHSCGHSKFRITKLENGQVYVQCENCRSMYLYSYTKFLLMYNDASKQSFNHL